MGVSNEQLLDEVLVLDRGSRLAASPAPLRLIFRQGLRFCVAGMGQRHHDILRLDQILGRQIEVIAIDLGAARVPVGRAHFGQLIPHDLGQTFRARKDVVKVADVLQKRLVLGDDLILLEPGQPV